MGFFLWYAIGDVKHMSIRDDVTLVTIIYLVRHVSQIYPVHLGVSSHREKFWIVKTISRLISSEIPCKDIIMEEIP
jgi:hypothetical protein